MDIWLDWAKYDDHDLTAFSICMLAYYSNHFYWCVQWNDTHHHFKFIIHTLSFITWKSYLLMSCLWFFLNVIFISYPNMKCSLQKKIKNMKHIKSLHLTFISSLYLTKGEHKRHNRENIEYITATQQVWQVFIIFLHFLAATA